jgi:hypothetical protein
LFRNSDKGGRNCVSVDKITERSMKFCRRVRRAYGLDQFERRS